MPPFELDDDERRVVDHGRGAMRVLGGAGTGKTVALRARFVRLVADADPERIALVVRTRQERDAARRAIHADLRVPLPALRVVTVQALARLVVAERYADLKYREPPKILVAADQFARVRELLAEQDPREWPAYGPLLRMRGFADEVRQFVIRAQEGLLSPERIQELAEERGLRGWVELARFYRRYLDVISGQDEIDFGGIVWQAATAARAREPMLDHLLVDDFQDTTEGTAELLAAIRATSTVVAGDPAAHVFSFQGTTVAPLLGFAERMQGCVDVTLARRWRGGDVAVDAWRTTHPSEEHAAIAHELRRIHVEDDVTWRDLAVVVRRKGPALASVVRALEDARVPHHVPEGGVTFTTEPSTWPYVLALAWIADPARRDELVSAVLTSRLAGLSPAAVRGLLRAARARGLTPADAIDERTGLSAEEARSLDLLADALTEATARADNVADAFMALWRALPVSATIVGAAPDAEEDGGALDAVLALSEAVNAAAEGPDPSVAAFVLGLEAGEDTPDLARLRDSGADAVQVLTAHAAAGREFDTVLVAGTVEGDFPSLSRPEPMFDLEVLRRVRSESARNAERLADERRLFDLVVARARRRVVLTRSVASEGEAGAAPSRFAADLPWEPIPDPDPTDPVSVADAARAWRRVLADRGASAGDRLLALDGLLALGERPERWWFVHEWSRPDEPYAGPATTSFSRLKALLDCELRYVLTQELGLGRPSGHPAWVGSAIHAVFEDVENGVVARRLDRMQAALAERWAPGVFPSRAISDAYLREARERWLPHWWEHFGPHPALGVEEPFAFDVDGMRLNGRIDRIGPLVGGDAAEGNEITDYKTGSTPSGVRDLKPGPEDRLQLEIYLLAVHRDPRLQRFLPVRQLDVAYVRGEERGGIAIRKVDVDVAAPEAAVAEIEERVRGLVGRVRALAASGAYPPSPSSDACDRCEVRSLCPAYEGAPLFPEPARGAVGP